MDDTIADHEISITGYDTIRNDRNGNGRGVAIYIRSMINYKAGVIKNGKGGGG